MHWSIWGEEVTFTSHIFKFVDWAQKELEEEASEIIDLEIIDSVWLKVGYFLKWFILYW